MPQNTLPVGLTWGQYRAILNSNATDVEDRLAQIETGGVQIISGSGAPDPGEGNVGDYYIDDTGYVIYGPKGAGGWPAGVSMSGFTPRGPWDSGTAYAANDVVTFENSLWVANTTNSNSQPTELNTDWDLLGLGDYFRGPWVTGTAYKRGHTVTYDGSVYRSKNLSFTSTIAPPSDTGNWDQLAAKGEQGIQGDQGVQGNTGPPGLTHQGAYNSGTTYAINDAVTFRSKLWRRKTVGSGVTPSLTNSTEWELIAGGFHYVGVDWATTTQYYFNDIVRYATNGNLYRVKNDHTSSTNPTVDTTNYEIFMLQGAKGDTGDPGPAGADGADGADGAPGPAGVGYTAGFVAPYAGSSVPTGWLECNGQAVSRTTEAALFTAIGTTWGVGDGSTTFNLPDFRGRTLVDDGTGGGLTARTLAGVGGEENHLLTTGELPAHSHKWYHSWLGNSTGGGAGDRVSQSYNGNDNGNRAYDTSNTGSGTAHNNMQPYAVVKYLIKT
jgi:microcystin-dependent protein